MLYNLILITYNLYCLFFDPTLYFYDSKFNIDNPNSSYSEQNTNTRDQSQTTSASNNYASSSSDPQPTTSSIDIASFNTEDPNVDFNVL